jgi:two-component system response regulator MprA
MRQKAHCVLIVEDDPDIRGALSALIASAGYGTLEAEHGRDALGQLSAGKEHVCMILLDLFMPDMNGWAFRAEQASDPEIATIPVVVLSADPESARRAVAPGVVGALTKPIDFERLLRIIGQYC